MTTIEGLILVALMVVGFVGSRISGALWNIARSLRSLEQIEAQREQRGRPS